MKKYLILLAGAVVLVFGAGTLIWVSVDVFALYSENQFTGRMRSFDVEYWDAVAGTAIVFIGSGFLKSIKTYIAAKAISALKEEKELDQDSTPLMKMVAQEMKKMEEFKRANM